MKLPSLRYELLADDKTAKGLNSAKKNIGSFEKKIDGLVKKFAALFAADKIIAFGKASVEAFAADQKSAALLANTLKNLGLAFADPAMEQFIQRMTMASGVADDVLRPAMTKLLNTTNDYFKSQELLTQALDISRGSGVDLGTVVQDLSNAYVGNTKGLKKYSLGLTQAELKTMSFADITKKLNDQFKGANAAYLGTYAGKMEVLKNAASEAQETIGKNLVDALMLVGKDTSVKDLATSMQDFADNIGNAIYGLGDLIAKLKAVGDATPSWLKSLGKIATTGNIFDAISRLANYGETQRNKTLENPSVQMFKTDMNNMRLNNLAAAKDRKERQKLLAAQKKLTEEQKKQAMLKKQAALFDLQQIELVAALKGKLSDEERDRVKLQLALLQGNEEEAAKLSAKIADAQDKTGQLAKYLATLPDAANPFKNWSTYLDAIQKQVATITGGGAGNTAGNTQVLPTANLPASVSTADFFSNLTPAQQSQYGGYSPYMNYGAAGTGSGNVTVNIDGKAVVNAILDQALNGNPAYINRTSGFFTP